MRRNVSFRSACGTTKRGGAEAHAPGSAPCGWPQPAGAKSGSPVALPEMTPPNGSVGEVETKSAACNGTNAKHLSRRRFGRLGRKRLPMHDADISEDHDPHAAITARGPVPDAPTLPSRGDHGPPATSGTSAPPQVRPRTRWDAAGQREPAGMAQLLTSNMTASGSAPEGER